MTNAGQVRDQASAVSEKLAAAARALQTVGRVEVGGSARDVILRHGKFILYRYRARTAVRNPVPLLVVYALVNRPYMLDLEPGRSTVRALLDAGLDVYLIDWGYPDDSDRARGLDEYVNGFIDRSVNRIGEEHDRGAINLLGVCQGGVLSICYSALHPEKIRNLVTMVTPVDFHTRDDLLSRWVRNIDVDQLVDTHGNIPGQLLNSVFAALKPTRLAGQKYLELVDDLRDPAKVKTFMRMEKWIHDTPDQPGEAFRQFVKDFYQGNALIKGEVTLGRRVVDLRAIKMPVLNLYASQDHIVPPAASRALEKYVASPDYTAAEFEGGHIGIYVSQRAIGEVSPRIARWLRERCRG